MILCLYLINNIRIVICRLTARTTLLFEAWTVCFVVFSNLDKGKLIQPTTTKTRTSARGTRTEQPVCWVSIKISRGNLINNACFYARGRKLHCVPSCETITQNKTTVTLEWWDEFPFFSLQVVLHMYWPYEGKQEGSPYQLLMGFVCH